MSVVIKFLKGVRNHWKKSTFAVVAIGYGANYMKNRIEINSLMREYCHKAARYGKQPIANNVKPRTVTVILNPNANRRKAVKQFQKYCAPILYLAGICVDVIKTESEGHAKQLMETLGGTDAIVVAGGDGTLSEVITGLMRRMEGTKKNIIPVGVLPLGRHNTVGKILFPGDERLKDVRSLADASLAIVEEFTKPVDVMKIETIDESAEKTGKPVYAISCLEWGAFRDAHARRDKYWYFGSLRDYITYIVNGFKGDLNWNCEATINYTLPCTGCSSCRQKEEEDRRWYHRFLPYKKQVPDFSNIENKECKEIHQKEISTVDFSLLTRNILPNMSAIQEEPAKLCLSLGPGKVDYTDFVTQGWKSENGIRREPKEIIVAKEIEIKPKVEPSQNKKVWYSIDKEDYEIKPVKVTLLPKALHMFCRKSDSQVV